jgi:hypothetical protein
MTHHLADAPARCKQRDSDESSDFELEFGAFRSHRDLIGRLTSSLALFQKSVRHGADNLAVRGGIVARSGSSITEIVLCATVQAIVAVPPEQTVVTSIAE